MYKTKYALIAVASLLLGLLGFIADFIYGIEEEATFEGGASQYYGFLRPVWTNIVIPASNVWYSIWRDDVMSPEQEVAIAFSFWFIASLMLVVLITLIWSKFRERSK